MAPVNLATVLYDLAPVGYLIVDDGGHVVGSNQVAGRLLDMTSDELVGLPVVDLVSAHDRRRFEGLWDHMIRVGDGVGIEFDLVHSTGEFVTVACHARWSMQLDAWLVALIDVTDLHHARRDAHDREQLAQWRDVADRLHDSIRQRVFGIATMVEAVAASAGLTAEASRLLGRVRDELAAIVVDMRRIAADADTRAEDDRSDGPPPGETA